MRGLAGKGGEGPVELRDKRVRVAACCRQEADPRPRSPGLRNDVREQRHIRLRCGASDRDDLPRGGHADLMSPDIATEPHAVVGPPSRSCERSERLAKAGAKGGSRTPKAFRPPDPKSGASASSATFALIEYIGRLPYHHRT